jgi:hypothetical protein
VTKSCCLATATPPSYSQLRVLTSWASLLLLLHFASSSLPPVLLSLSARFPLPPPQALGIARVEQAHLQRRGILIHLNQT